MSVAVPDEPAPPAQPLLDYGEKHPCIQSLERMIVNDAWNGAALRDAQPDAPSVNEDGQQSTESSKSKKQINYAPQLNDLGQAIITGYSLQGYIRMLNVDHARAVGDRLYTETETSLKKLWGYEGTVRFDDDPTEACVKIARLAASRCLSAHQQQPSSQSPSSATSDDPTGPTLVAYLSPCVPYPGLAKAISTETRITFAPTAPSVRLVNDESSIDNDGAVDGRMDVDILAEMLEADTPGENGCTTALVVAVVGSPIFGHNDYVSKLLQLREKYGFWLHLVGYNTAALAMPKPPEQLIRVLRSADSVTLPLGRWLGLETLPVITYVNMPDYGGSLHQREKLACLPWWIVTNCLTTDDIQKRISAAFRTSADVLKRLLSHPRIQLPGLGKPADILPRIEKGTIMPPPVLTFKYSVTRPSTDTKTGEVDDEIVNDEYVDHLNLWLMEGLAAAKPSLRMQLVDLSKCNLGAAIRFCPLEHPALAAKTSEYVQAFGERLRSALSILDATIAAREHLESVLLEKYPELRLIRTKSWAGVGDLVYLPAMYRSSSASNNDGIEQKRSPISIDAFNDEQRRQISHFNIELVHKLRANDRAFAHGELPDGLRCVRLGMLADARDLEPLTNLVVKVGKEIEESSQYVDSLAELVRRGIEAANEGLRRENDERLMKEGVLRQVPVVGSFMNWWSPVPVDTKARGRTFDLKTGSVISSADLVAKDQSGPRESVSLATHVPPSEATSTNSETEPQEHHEPTSA